MAVRAAFQLFLAICVGVFVCGCRMAFTPLPRKETRTYQSLLEWSHENGMPGAILLIQTPQTNFLGALGWADVKRKIPMRPEHEFRIGSITKMFTGLTVLQLERDGLLKTDSVITNYLPKSITDHIANSERITAAVAPTWKPNLLYLLASPHPRLYVEVDAVEGCAPNDVTLQNLRDFLSKYCNKPGGIEIVRSDVIPIESARGISEKGLARKYINGPDKAMGSTPAFMYVLFYNDALCKDSAKAEHPGTAQRSRRPAAKPYTDVSRYPAIYINTRYFPWYFPGVDRKCLLHEAGHMLGLVHRPTGVSFHCTNRTCLLNSDIYLHRSLLGQQKKLCPQCAAELAESSTQQPPSNLRFVGAVLARSEIGYHVLSLPDRLLLLVGDFTEEHSEEFAAHVHAETPGTNGSIT